MVSHPDDRSEREAEQVSKAMVDAAGNIRAPEASSVNERPASRCNASPTRRNTAITRARPRDHDKAKEGEPKPAVDLSDVTVDNVEQSSVR